MKFKNILFSIFTCAIISCNNSSKTEVSESNQELDSSRITNQKTEKRIDTLSRDLISKLDSFDLSFLRDKEVVYRSIDYFWLREYKGVESNRIVVRSLVNSYDMKGNSYLKIISEISEDSLLFLNNEKVYESFKILEENRIESILWDETHGILRFHGIEGEMIFYLLDGDINEIRKKIHAEIINVKGDWYYFR